MRAQIRMKSTEYNVPRVVQQWQARYRTSGAVHFADPSTLLVGADIEVEALENLLWSLRATEVEVIWRSPRVEPEETQGILETDVPHHSSRRHPAGPGSPPV